ncbi:MAG: hypothetical protein K2Z81_01220 [Cyanobacteria bacterium]|nr:hypothetical protein [Cyanobacteriota bacterium]
MNKKQKLAFFLGILLVALMGVFPPWKEFGPRGAPLQYAPIFAPPQSAKEKGPVLDLIRLFLQIGITFMVAGGVVALAATPQEGLSKTTSQSDSHRVENEEPSRLSDEECRTLELPGDHRYGEVLVESTEDEEYWEFLCELRGTVRLPARRRIQLEVKGDDSVDLSFISLIEPDIFYSIDLSDTKVKDWELANLKKLVDLKELDLSGTSISSQALAYLRGLNKLEKLWLDGTTVDDSCITDLKRLDKLKKLSLRNSRVSTKGLDELKESLPDCQIES